MEGKDAKYKQLVEQKVQEYEDALNIFNLKFHKQLDTFDELSKFTVVVNAMGAAVVKSLKVIKGVNLFISEEAYDDVLDKVNANLKHNNVMLTLVKMQ